MNAPRTLILVLALLAAATLAPTASAQAGSSAWHGQDSEFGSIRAPYSADMDGERVPVEAQIVLRRNYEEQDSRFFMFAWSVENTPLDVEFTNLIRTDTGAELPCYQRQGDARSQIKCFVDLRDMPPAGTEIVMRGTAGATKIGTFQIGAIVVPFTYTWTRVPMSNGLNAELYGYTLINVSTPTAKGAGPQLGGLGNAVPGVGVAGAVAAVAVAAAGVALFRRGRA